MKNQKGFTLIELMVVIVIIGILAAVAIPRMTGVSDKAKATEAVNAIGAYESLQKAYTIEAEAVGTGVDIGFSAPPAASSDFTYTTAALGVIIANPDDQIGECGDVDADQFHSASVYVSPTLTMTRTSPGCAALSPSFAGVRQF